MRRLTQLVTPTSRDGLFDLCSLVVFIGFAVVAITTFGDYGITLDERSHLLYGDRVFDFYANGFGSSDTYSQYGAGFDLPAAALRRMSAMGRYEVGHYLGGVVGLLGLVGVWKLGRALFGASGGFLAALLLVTTPAYYGHIFNNPKDVPFAVAHTWAIYYLVVAVHQMPAVTRRVWIKFAVALGLAMSVRIGGLVVAGYLLLSIAMFAGSRGWAARSGEIAWRCLRGLGWRALAAFTGAWVVLLPLWPWVWPDPFGRAMTALSTFSHYTSHSRPMPFHGEWIDSSAPAPWDYLPTYFALKLPEILVFALVAACFFGGRHVLRAARDRRLSNTTIAYVIVATAAVFPPVYAAVKSAPLYDGLRHFLFVVPVLCVLGAGALVCAADEAGRLMRAGPALAYSVVAAGIVATIVAMIELHPHEYVYFNRFGGGLRGAAGNYSTNYYGGAYREAFEELARHVWTTEPEVAKNHHYKVTGCFTPAMLAAQLPPTFSRADTAADFDVSFTRARCHMRHPNAPVVFRIERQGTPLIIVRDLRRVPR